MQRRWTNQFRRLLDRLALALILALCIQTHSWAQNATVVTADTAKRIDGMFAAWDNRQSPGCALGVTLNGNLVYSRGYGMASLEDDVPITPDSIFNIGSISKQFTAFSVALLASEGKLSLDDDVRRYFPLLPGGTPKITVRHLLTHTSGLRDAWDLVFLRGVRAGEVITQRDVLSMVSRQQAPDFVAGTEYFYNNAGYIVLAEIVKIVSGKSQREFAEAHLFGPLGMRRTSIQDDRTTIVRSLATGHRPKAGGGWTKWFPMAEVLGADGVMTNVGDLLKWEENFVDAGVGGRALVDEMQTSGRLNTGTLTGYGFGLEVGTYRGARAIGHGGTAGGYASNVVRFPDQHLAVAALCNLRSINPRALTRGVADIFLGSGALAPPVPVAPSMAVAEAELAALTGTYWNPLVGIRRFFMQDGRLTADGTGPLTPLGSGRFRALANELLFPPPRGGTPQELHTLAPTETVVFSRVTAPSYSPSQLSAYVGEYRSDELEATFKIIARSDGDLVAVRDRTDPKQLTPLRRDAFFSDFSDGAGTLTFARATSGEVTGFVITGRTPRGLAFTRVRQTPSPDKAVRTFELPNPRLHLSAAGAQLSGRR
jgi:CubicO group peptidase (beta-lactamase class C family)